MTDIQKEQITEKVFEMLAHEKSTQEIIEATGIKDLEVISDEFDYPIILTIDFTDGQGISHWL